MIMPERRTALLSNLEMVATERLKRNPHTSTGLLCDEWLDLLFNENVGPRQAIELMTSALLRLKIVSVTVDEEGRTELVDARDGVRVPHP